jgi:hypothetical protein
MKKTTTYTLTITSGVDVDALVHVDLDGFYSVEISTKSPCF